MKEENLDRWRDRMVAALYEELPADEMKELEAAMEADADLRRDWEELREARAALRVLDDVPPGKVDFELPPIRSAGPTAEVIPFRRLLLPVAAGFAAATLLFTSLLVAGLRVDAAGPGVLVSFDRKGVEQETGTVGDVAPDELRISRADLATLAQVMVDATAARLDDLERRQTSAQSEVARALYDALAGAQEHHYNDLRARIDYAAVRGGQGQRSPSNQQFD